jgi:methyl-accepting chemotaxis protein
VEQMQQQEEEIRQNMEEMVATQEEMEKQTMINAEQMAEMKGVMAGIDATMATIEFKPDGTIITANDNFLSTVKYTLPEIHGKHHRIFVPADIANSAEYAVFWDNLATGIPSHAEIRRIDAQGNELKLNAIYSPVKNSFGEVVKVLKLATVIA